MHTAYMQFPLTMRVMATLSARPPVFIMWSTPAPREATTSKFGHCASQSTNRGFSVGECRASLEGAGNGVEDRKHVDNVVESRTGVQG